MFKPSKTRLSTEAQMRGAVHKELPPRVARKVNTSQPVRKAKGGEIKGYRRGGKLSMTEFRKQQEAARNGQGAYPSWYSLSDRDRKQGLAEDNAKGQAEVKRNDDYLRSQGRNPVAERYAAREKGEEETAKRYEKTHPEWRKYNDATKKAIVMQEFYRKGSQGTGKKNFLFDIATQAMDPMMQNGLNMAKDWLVDSSIGAIKGGITGGASGAFKSVGKSALDAGQKIANHVMHGHEARYETPEQRAQAQQQRQAEIAAGAPPPRPQPQQQMPVQQPQQQPQQARRGGSIKPKETKMRSEDKIAKSTKGQHASPTNYSMKMNGMTPIRKPAQGKQHFAIGGAGKTRLGMMNAKGGQKAPRGRVARNDF